MNVRAFHWPRGFADTWQRPSLIRTKAITSLIDCRSLSLFHLLAKNDFFS
jgi:hypothetical protein